MFLRNQLCCASDMTIFPNAHIFYFKHQGQLQAYLDSVTIILLLDKLLEEWNQTL